MSEDNIQSIEIINNRVKAIVERDTLDDRFWVEGEISNVYPANSGHIYFNLHEDNYSIRCMLQEKHRGKLSFTPQNGMEVGVYGVIRVYAEKVTIEIAVEDMRLVQGQRMTNFADVEEQLRKRGLYPNEKKFLPERVNRIALLTSKRSEAYHDFINHYRERNGLAIVTMVDVRVEGEYAPRQIANEIDRLSREGQHDVILLTRGGGPRSRMTIYDDVLMAEAIIKSEIPVVTAIGHQQDEFFADRVADVKYNTPTDAGVKLAEHSVVMATSQSAIEQYGWLIAIGGIVLLVAIIVVIALGS